MTEPSSHTDARDRFARVTGASLFVALPVHRTFESATVLSLMRLQHAMPSLCFSIIAGNSRIDLARAELVEVFLASGCESLLWIDADSSFEPETVARLIAADRDMIGVPFAKKQITFPAAMRAAAVKDVQNWEQAGLSFTAGVPENGRVDIDDRGAVRVDWIGCGLTLVRRRVFERVIAAHPDLVCTLRDEQLPAPIVRAMLFHPMLVEGLSLGEDISFCRRWTAIGGEIHALVEGPDVGHHGSYSYSGSLLGSLAARGMLRPLSTAEAAE